MARKNLLASLTDPKLTAVNSDTPASPSSSRASLPFASMGAIGAVTRSIDDLAAKAAVAKELEAKLTSGQTIVELDTDLVDSSFISDRMSLDDEAYRTLRSSIALSGQESPILVRPHPSEQGRYQAAFGHRRLRAAKDLAKPVRAVVRQLSDRELILAQGQENSARANLSFIERARFAHKLEASGYDRDTIMQALSVDKTILSRFVSVVSRIPVDIIEAIGPAPSTGRDRWIELANLFQTHPQQPMLAALVSSESFQVLESDARFVEVKAAVEASTSNITPKPAEAEKARDQKPAEMWAHSSGRSVMKVKATDRGLVLSIDNRAVPGFGEYLLSEMETLVTAYLNQPLASAVGAGSKRSKNK